MEIPKNLAELPRFIEQRFTDLMHSNANARHIWMTLDELGFSVEQRLKLIAVSQAEQVKNLISELIKAKERRPIIINNKGEQYFYDPVPLPGEIRDAYFTEDPPSHSQYVTDAMRYHAVGSSTSPDQPAGY